jgi:hypothetical protein
MTGEKIPYKCSCGGNLRKMKVEVEFFGIDFGLRDAEVCVACGSEYLDHETLKEVEMEIKKRNIFAMERKVQVAMSGDSLVIKIPPEIAEFLDIHYKSLVQLFPVDRNRLEVMVTG